MNAKLVLSALCSLAFCSVAASPTVAQVAEDSTWVKKIKTITTPAEFVSLDIQDSNRFTLSVDGAGMRFYAGTPELQCYLANHIKAPLRITYEVWERNVHSETSRAYKVIRIVDNTYGDDTKTWREKELSDSDRLKRNHEALRRYLEEAR